MGPKIYCFLLRFSVFGWFMNSDVGPSKKRKRKIIAWHAHAYDSRSDPTIYDPTYL